VESFEKKGIWWLPADPKSSVGGILSFSAGDGLHLQLLGALREIPQFDAEPIPVIFGYVEGKGQVTLERCLPAGTTMTFPGAVYESYWPSAAYAGAHLEDPKSTTFVKARIEFDHLADWIQESGIAVMIARSDAQTPIRVEYSYPPPRRADAGGGSVSIKFSARTDGDIVRSFTIHQGTSLLVEPGMPQQFDSLWETLIYPLQSFLTLATGQANVLTSLTLYTDAVLLALDGNRTARAPIQVYFQTQGAAERRERRLYPQDMLFTLRDIEPHFQEVVQKWLRISEESNRCVALFTGTHFFPRPHLDRMFLALAQAAETFHRNRFGSTQFSRAEFRKRRKTILGLCPATLRDWLEEVLQGANELRFRQRVEELMEKYGECVRPLCGDRGEFVGRVVATRNYYTHFSGSLVSKAARRTELYLLGQQLSVLIRACLLGELGFSAKERRRLFLRNQEFLSLLRESPPSTDRELFSCGNIDERNRRIVKAYESGQYTQREISLLVGLDTSTISRIIRRSREKGNPGGFQGHIP